MATSVKTTISFPEATQFRVHARPDESTELLITTQKGYRDGIDVIAHVQGHDGSFTTFASSDFRVTITNFPAKRVTQKRLDTIHAETVSEELIQNVKISAIAYYSDQAKLKAARGY